MRVLVPGDRGHIGATPFPAFTQPGRRQAENEATGRLSIVLPVYNGEKYLAESIEALLGQSYEDFELIISDNASTDSTADICRRYEKQDSRIRYIRQPRNIGLVPKPESRHQAKGRAYKEAAHDDLWAVIC